CSFYADMDGSGPGHMNSHDAGTLAQKAAVKELILTHLPHFGEHEILIKQAAEKYLGKITLARQFLKLAI
ncbi:MAG: MBL fold metallo-hydrolase, partial [Firmicutes bacterium]|nr:MBL fold metallo-hydrolase [Bacillota bacterium]